MTASSVTGKGQGSSPRPTTPTGFTVGRGGLVPPPSQDDINAQKILRADGKWATGPITPIPELPEHGTEHVTGGDDPIPPVSALNDGLMTSGNLSKLESAILNNGSVEMSADQSMSGFRLTNLGTPTQSNDAATKSFAEAVGSNLSLRAACLLATTGNITLSGNQTIDGVLTVNDNRVLVKDQTDATENGIYTSNSGAWARSLGADEDSEVINGLTVFVSTGTVNATTSWAIITPDPITLGITDITFTQFGKATEYTSGDGIDITGNTISVDVTDLVGTGITTSDNNLVLDVHGADHVEGGLDAIPNATTLTGGLLSAADKTKLNDIESNAKDDQTASEVATSVGSFDGKLSAADDTVQKALDTLDNHVPAHSDLTGIGIDDHHARDHASTHSKSGADEIIVTGLAAGSTNAQLRLAPTASGALSFAAGLPYQSATVTTSNATATTIATIAVTDNTVVLIDAIIVGRSTNTSARAGYMRRSVVYRAGGNAIIQGAVQNNLTIESVAAWNATVTINGTNALITVTGAASTTINWKAEYNLTII